MKTYALINANSPPPPPPPHAAPGLRRGFVGLSAKVTALRVGLLHVPFSYLKLRPK